MRTLIVGAGAIGGYFGGRMLQAGRDVTFLVRPERAARLAESGLDLASPTGPYHHPHPPTVLAGQLREPFDLVLLSCKAYDLEGALTAFAPAVGPGTAILPLLNGMGHLERLEHRFGAGAVLGGLCLISSTLDEQGRIRHLNDLHQLVYGELNGDRTPRMDALAAEFEGAPFVARASTAVLQEMWEKWVFIATAAGINCLMRASFGDIVAAGGADLASALLDECAAIAAGQGFPPRAEALQRSRSMVTAAGSPITASMLKDLERGGRTEGEHILGDLLRRGGVAAPSCSLLRTAYVHILACEARRAREAQAGQGAV